MEYKAPHLANIQPVIKDKLKTQNPFIGADEL